MKIFSLGVGEITLIVLIAILAIGPKETAKLARRASEFIKSAKGLLNDLTSEVTRAASDIAENSNEKAE
ncbi:twin-arginine translocase TatA/TatE family subunit [Chloroflexota bacterium]